MTNDHSPKTRNEETKAPEAADEANAEVEPEAEVELRAEHEAKRGTRRISLSLETVRNLTPTNPALGKESLMRKHTAPHCGPSGENCGASRANCLTNTDSA